MGNDTMSAVDAFCDVGREITGDGRGTEDIKCRMATGGKAFREDEKCANSEQ